MREKIDDTFGNTIKYLERVAVIHSKIQTLSTEAFKRKNSDSEYTKQIDYLKAELQKSKADISSKIELLDNEFEKQFLILRYIELKRLSEIAIEMNCSISKVKKICAMAVYNLSNIYMG